MNPPPLRLLIVEDEAAHVEAIRRAFDQAATKADIQSAGTLREYRERIAAQPPDLALMDLNLPDGRASEVLTHPPADAPFPILVMTAFGSEQIVMELAKAGALDYVVKSPGAFAAMPQTVARALREWQLLQREKRAEERLRLQASALDAAANAIVITDPAGNIEWVNPAFTRLTGYAFAEVFGQNPRALKSGRHDAAFYADLWQTILAGRVWRGEMLNKRKDGTLYSEEMTITPVRDDAGKIANFVAIKQDITERKRAEKTLQDSESRYRHLFENNPHPMWVYELETLAFLAVNEAAVGHYGYSREEFLRMTLKDIRPAEEIPALLESVSRSSPGLEKSDSWRHRKKDGTLIDVEIVSHPVEFEGRRAKLVLANDITERKRDQEMMRASEVRYRRLFEAAKDGILILDAGTGMIVDVNPFLIELLGFPREVFLASKVWEMGCFKDILANQARFVELQQIEFMRYDDKPLEAADGRRVPVEFVSNVYQVNHHKVIQCNIRDITERKQAEVALQESEQNFRALAEVVPQIVWATRPDGWNIYFNQRWVEYTGLTLEASYGHGWNTPFHPDDQKRSWDTWQQATQQGAVYSLEARLRRADGIYRWWLVRGEPLRDTTGKIVKWFGTCTDIDDLKRAEGEIRRLNTDLERRVQERTTKLEEANKELESFSHSVSHDLRAPLRHVQGYVEMLTEAAAGQLSGEARRYLQVITDASVEMGQLIDDLLAFSRMGRAEMNEGCVHLDRLVRDTIQGLEMATRGRNIVWKIAPLPPVLGDPSLLKQVLANLMGNAVKYSRPRDPAEIEIGGAGQEDGRLILFVRDNGAGFDMRYAHKLFGVFQRLHRAEEFEGTGIGLANVRRIITRHGGRTWAEGKVGEGATFYFTLKPAAAT